MDPAAARAGRRRWVVEDAGGSVVAYGLCWMEVPPDEVVAEQLVDPGASWPWSRRTPARPVRSAGRGAGPCRPARRPPPRSACGRTRATRAGSGCSTRGLPARASLPAPRARPRRQPRELPVWPAGITVAAFRPGVDDAAVHAAHEEAFPDHYGPRGDGPRGVAESRFAHEDPDLGLWFVAWDGERWWAASRPPRRRPEATWESSSCAGRGAAAASAGRCCCRSAPSCAARHAHAPSSPSTRPTRPAPSACTSRSASLLARRHPPVREAARRRLPDEGRRRDRTRSGQIALLDRCCGGPRAPIRRSNECGRAFDIETGARHAARRLHGKQSEASRSLFPTPAPAATSAASGSRSSPNAVPADPVRPAAGGRAQRAGPAASHRFTTLETDAKGPP